MTVRNVVWLFELVVCSAVRRLTINKATSGFCRASARIRSLSFLSDEEEKRSEQEVGVLVGNCPKRGEQMRHEKEEVLRRRLLHLP